MSCKFWEEEKVELLRKRYPEEGPSLLCKELGVTYGGLLQKTHRLGLKYKYYKRDAAKTKAANSTYVNHDYFKSWSPNMAYILGYIYADGCVSVRNNSKVLSFGCVESDGKLLLDIAEEMKSAHAIVRQGPRKRGPYTTRPFVRMAISSRFIVDSLIEIGVLPRKSRTDTPLPSVPECLFRHFVRGYFDGDGTQSLSSRNVAAVGFCGQRLFITQLQEKLCLLTGIKKAKILTRGKHLVQFTNAAKKDVRRLYSFLYPEEDYLFLERRKEWFLKVMNSNLV